MTVKVVWHTTMSIDGYIADRNDSLDWAFGHDGWLVPRFDEIIGGVRLHRGGGRDRARPGGGWRQGVMVLGSSVASQCLTAGLVDELLIHQVPVLLGGGVRLFANPSGPPVALDVADVTPAGQITSLRLRVKR